MFGRMTYDTEVEERFGGSGSRPLVTMSRIRTKTMDFGSVTLAQSAQTQHLIMEEWHTENI